MGKKYTYISVSIISQMSCKISAYTGCWQKIQYHAFLFKTFKTPHNSAPSYTSDRLHPSSTFRPLRLTDQSVLTVPHTLHKSKGDCAFAVRAPSLWNSSPTSSRFAESVNTFKKLLKTHFYHLAFLPLNDLLQLLIIASFVCIICCAYI